jgi:carboxymethylenebutenolidase
MGAITQLTAKDGHRLTIYRADPIGRARGGVVLLHEIYGLTSQMRGLADRLADEGFAVIAPSLFDRAEKGVEIDYTEAGAARGRALRDAVGWDAPLLDIAAACAALPPGKMAVIGESYGGSLAWRAAASLRFDAAVCGSPGNLADFLHETPKCPVLIHFGADDPKTPTELRARARAIPGVTVAEYAAGHAFTCPVRDGYDAEASRAADAATLAFLARHLG